MEVTFLFTKMSGSTELLQHLGDYRYGEVLAEHQRLLRAAFEAEGGQEVDTQGDAFFVAFPRASGAVVAAASAQQAIAVHPWPDGATVRVRCCLYDSASQKGDRVGAPLPSLHPHPSIRPAEAVSEIA